MCGRPKCLARARAIVPFPLAAGPSTAITNPLRGDTSVPRFLFKRRALTGADGYGKAPPNAGAVPARRSYNQRDLLE